jgi:4-oxalocrotonate tautomerase
VAEPNWLKNRLYLANVTMPYLGVHHSDDCIFLQITLNSGRSVELKQRLYKAIADGLHEGLKLRKEDVFINLVEVPRENWSYGDGEAQYVSPSR